MRTKIVCLEHGVCTMNTNQLMFNEPSTEGKIGTHVLHSQEIISQTQLHTSRNGQLTPNRDVFLHIKTIMIVKAFLFTLSQNISL